MCPLCPFAGFIAIIAGWFGYKSLCKNKKKDRQ